MDKIFEHKILIKKITKNWITVSSTKLLSVFSLPPEQKAIAGEGVQAFEEKITS